MSESPPIWVYLGYCGYVVYTGFYVYNRRIGRSAQFGTATVMPDDSRAFKLFADVGVGAMFLFMAGVMLYVSIPATR